MCGVFFPISGFVLSEKRGGQVQNYCKTCGYEKNKKASTIRLEERKREAAARAAQLAMNGLDIGWGGGRAPGRPLAVVASANDTKKRKRGMDIETTSVVLPMPTPTEARLNSDIGNTDAVISDTCGDNIPTVDSTSSIEICNFSPEHGASKGIKICTSHVHPGWGMCLAHLRSHMLLSKPSFTFRCTSVDEEGRQCYLSTTLLDARFCSFHIEFIRSENRLREADERFNKQVMLSSLCIF